MGVHGHGPAEDGGGARGAHVSQAAPGPLHVAGRIREPARALRRHLQARRGTSHQSRGGSAMEERRVERHA